ncbi:hypothetical protein HZS_3789, partial [Henneguya salminicola]
FYSFTEKDRRPLLYGPLDTRLGVSSVKNNCVTCGHDLSSCIGHFGNIDLNMPCFHSGYLPKIIQILQCICKECGQLLIDSIEKQKMIKRLASSKISDLAFKAHIKKIIQKSKTVRYCQKCNSLNGVVKKFNSIKIVHELPQSQSKIKKSSNSNSGIVDLSKFNVDSIYSNQKYKKFLNPLHVLNLFHKIPTRDYIFLGLRRNSSPFNMILTQIPVPPACIRPSVISDFRSGSNEDDLTIKLSEIIFKNNSLYLDIKKGYKMESLNNSWDTLQMLICMYILGDVKGLPLSMMPKEPIRSLINRLKGKHGRFRGNLSGKRVDFSGRTVISPDPNIAIDQVVVPLCMALILTFPEQVNRYNIEILRKAILNGPDVHPGANFLISLNQSNRKYLRYGNKEEIVKNLKPGDIVERHITDGDIVLFNRQPSLHRISIMAHRVKVMNSRTLRFNECVCTPYNADFDGDEMNIHVPQTYEARAEAYQLLGVKKNITTPRNGDPLISSIQDFITGLEMVIFFLGAYLLTNKDTFLTCYQFCLNSCSFLCDDDQNTILHTPIPAILKPNVLWTGKQVISCMIKPNPISIAKINIRTKGKSYTQDEELCHNDSFVVFYNGLHICGSLDKNTIGSGSKKTIFYAILREYGADECSKIMLRLNRISVFFLTQNGFSIGINDVSASSNLMSQMESLVEQGYNKCNQYIDDCFENRLVTQPGCSLEETLEAVILKELSTIRDLSGKMCVKELHKSCSPLIMALCGSKGSFINISQMIACVGQQAINGKRTPNGFENRSLPRFKRFSKTPEAKGFVRNSFFLGLTPTEFYFHTMAGREGLVDTAVKTAETGYMQRRLVKCLEDLCIQYDNTVRTNNKQIVQFLYGGDGLDPIEMEGDEKPVDMSVLFNNIKCQNYSPIESGLNFTEIMKIFNSYTSSFFKDFSPVFVNALKEYLQNIINVDSEYIHTHNKITETILLKFLDSCVKKYRQAIIEPGTTVGPLCAQSIGEPATQMTLKTFHFAGVAAMNITLGVPRLKEIINASANISTPIITVPIDIDCDIDYARRVKGRIEKTTLGHVCSSFSEIYSDETCCIRIQLDMGRIKLLQLEIDLDTVAKAIIKSPSLKLRPNQVVCMNPSIIAIYPERRETSSRYFVLQHLKAQLNNLLIKGFPSINRAIVHFDDNSKEKVPRYKLLVEGNDLASVISTKSVVSSGVTCNNTITVLKVLGVEAARQTIINEVSYTMKNHGINVDIRHFTLLADLMSCSGEILGITRYGLSKMKESTLMLASFEKTADHLFDAAFYSSQNKIRAKGVSESIIVGSPIGVGTGMFRVLQKSLTKEKTTHHINIPLFE